jgi:hypothetical protein
LAKNKKFAYCKEETMAKRIFWVGMLGILLTFTAPVIVSAQDFTDGTILVQAQGTITVTITGRNPNTGETITRTYYFNVPTSGQAGGGAAAVAKAEAESKAMQRFEREYPGFQIRNIQSR